MQKKLRNMASSTEQINALVEKFGLSETVKQEIIKITEIAYNEGHHNCFATILEHLQLEVKKRRL